MNFVIDRGNTLYKTAVFDGEKLVETECYEHLTLPTLRNIFSKWRIEKSILCSVAGKEADEVFDFLNANSKFVSMTDEVKFPIEISYKTQSTLGKDRIASVVGAADMFKGHSVLVIDAGSCICCDYLDRHSVYRGGSIAPGFAMKYKALHNFTANLPLLELEKEDVEVCGGATSECMQSGVVNGTLFELRGFVDAYLEMDKELAIVLSGGDCNYIAERLNREVIVEKHLVVRGLNVILDANTK